MPDSATSKSWSLLQMIQWSTEYLGGKGFENSRLLAERLLAHVLKLRRVDLYLQFDRPLTNEELARYKDLFLRLVAHEPLQYLLGATEFMSLPFLIGPGALIPRPETELLVEKALVQAQEFLKKQEQIRIADIGTGSGCIAIALAHELPGATVVAIDVSADALKWAAKNSELNGVSERVTLVQHDLAGAPATEWRGAFDLVVSNPPYIRLADWEKLDPEIRDHEPREALIGGEDGLDAYRHLAQGLPYMLKRDGHAFLEIGDGTAGLIENLFKEAGFQESVVFHDLAGKERLVQLFSLGGNHE